MATDWKIGDRIQNRWEIYKILKGGMGIVYIVYDHEWQDTFAAKTFQDEVFARSPALVQRFTQEALAWINLDVHQNVTRARTVHNISDKPYLFLEYVSGGDLSGWIGTPRLTKDIQQVLRFAIQFCDGMTHALSKEVKAHRDIKPQNCLITEEGTLKVTDFGLAKVLDDAGAGEETRDVNNLNIGLTCTGMAAGTPTHMAPEQFDDAKHVDIRADIYSFGVMLYQMIEGRLPFVGRSGEEFARLHKTEKPPALNGRLPEINTVVQICLAKSPGYRFGSFGEVREELAGTYEELTGEPSPQPAIGEELDASGWHNKGMSLNNLGRYEEAIQCCDRAIDLSPRSGQTWSNKGGALFGLDRPEEAIACFDQAIELDSHDGRVWHNKGVALSKLGRSEEALACCDRAIELNPHYEAAWSNKGIALHALGRSEEALVCFDQALEITPRLREAWNNKGMVLNALSRSEEALICYDQAIKINPRNEQEWYNKGIVLNALGRSREALEYYDRALELNPRFREAWNNRGMVLNALSRSEEALICYDRALDLDSLSVAAWNNKGDALNALGRSKEALACCDRAIELNPHYEAAWSNKGIALWALGRSKEALACYDRAIEINSHDESLWHNKGDALIESGRSEEALACCDRAIEINPGYARAWFNKGAALVNAFQLYSEALVCFEEAQRLGFLQAAQAIALCRQLLGR